MKSKFGEDYAMLGLEPFTCASQVKKAWRRWAASWHPDKAGGDAKKFDQGKQAQSRLLGPAAEAERDEHRRQSREARRTENGKYAPTSKRDTHSTAGKQHERARVDYNDVVSASANAHPAPAGADDAPRDPPDTSNSLVLSELWASVASARRTREAPATSLKVAPAATGMSTGGLLLLFAATTAAYVALTRNKKDANGVRHSRDTGQFTSAFHDLFG
jgi:hypothetical protein